MVRKTIEKARTQDAAPPARRKIEVPADAAEPTALVAQPPAPAESEIVTVKIPRDFRLTLDSHHEVQYKAGIDEMPIEHAKHWFAVANGVEIYKGRS